MTPTYPSANFATPQLTFLNQARQWLETHKVSRRICRLIPDATLHPLTGVVRPLSANEVPLIVVLRNEARFIRSFLHHYRHLGVTRFLCVDDASTDETRDMLSDEPDVDVFVSNIRFGDARRGRQWREQIAALHDVDRWYINVDIDEYLIFEDYENRPLADFLKEMSSRGILRGAAPMIDCYPDGPLSNGIFDGKGDDRPWDVAPMFDGDGYELTPSKRLLSLTGGPRKRLYGANLELMKYPLMFWRSGVTLGHSIHQPTPFAFNFTPIVGVLLHFKFFSDIDKMLNTAISDRQYINKSAAYRQMEGRISPKTDLSYEGSTRFHGSLDLVQRGFIQPMNRW